MENNHLYAFLKCQYGLQAVVDSCGLSLGLDLCYLAADSKVVVPTYYIAELMQLARWKTPTKIVKQMMDDMLDPEQYGITGGTSALKTNHKIQPILEAIECKQVFV